MQSLTSLLRCVCDSAGRCRSRRCGLFYWRSRRSPARPLTKTTTGRRSRPRRAHCRWVLIPPYFQFSSFFFIHSFIYIFPSNTFPLQTSLRFFVTLFTSLFSLSRSVLSRGYDCPIFFFGDTNTRLIIHQRLLAHYILENFVKFQEVIRAFRESIWVENSLDLLQIFSYNHGIDSTIFNP